jgi:DNA-directed RNA polymerase sigma subunit (sigma70/sigma32)
MIKANLRLVVRIAQDYANTGLLLLDLVEGPGRKIVFPN